MVNSTLPQLEQKVQLSGISWQTYQALLSELSDRRLCLTYNQGNLEIMVPSPEHEFYKTLMGRFVETIAEELKIKIHPLGSTTFAREDLGRGLEPAECFYIRNQAAVKGKKRLDPTQDSPPDLVVEIDITSSSRDRMASYAALGVPEIWRYDGKVFRVYQLQNQEYQLSEASLAFPNVAIAEITRFLEQSATTDYLVVPEKPPNFLGTQTPSSMVEGVQPANSRGASKRITKKCGFEALWKLLVSLEFARE
uniref:Uma2 family endonuclease n=1 Tax=Trichocoleus desertorum TaxID=1481672 RepID=UPI0025B3EF5C|nr:Uma2 family endonuclease [Trichocoleus desertorum]